jgi:hypothetical protein
MSNNTGWLFAKPQWKEKAYMKYQSSTFSIQITHKLPYDHHLLNIHRPVPLLLQPVGNGYILGVLVF